MEKNYNLFADKFKKINLISAFQRLKKQIGRTIDEFLIDDSKVEKPSKNYEKERKKNSNLMSDSIKQSHAIQ